MGEFASKGVAGAGLGLGIAGTALGVLNGGWGNLRKAIWQWETRIAMSKVLEMKYKLSTYRSMR